jgi:hypothetical protein
MKKNRLRPCNRDTIPGSVFTMVKTSILHGLELLAMPPPSDDQTTGANGLVLAPFSVSATANRGFRLSTSFVS